MSKILALLACILLTQCVIQRGVTPATGLHHVRHVCVVTNPSVLMGGLHPEIVKQLQIMGYSVSTTSSPPFDGTPYLTYTANWRWDMAMYLTYFKAELHQGGNVLGAAEYNARAAGFHFGKFGRTAEKIRPLLTQLMGRAPLER